MNDQTPKPHVAAIEPTLDAAPHDGPGVAPSGEASSERAECGRVALVEGSAPGLTCEMETLLRGRLRLAALVMFFGYLAFLPQHFFQADFRLPDSVFLFTFHIVVVAATGLLGGILFRHCPIPMFRLRVVELAMFGLSAAFLAGVQRFSLLREGEELSRIREAISCEHADLSLQAGLWLLLLFTYALFVPNTPRRAAMVIGAIAATPVVIVLVIMARHEEIRALLTYSELTGFALIMVVAAVTGVFGVDTIGSLRREAFEARQLGQYRLTKRIGEGGMGEVYLAEHQMLKRACAIKLIRPDKAADLHALARFEREVRATAKLSHWNTVEIFDYGRTDDGTFYYVMEYLPGMSLREIVDRFGPMPPERVVHLLRQVCDALGEAHAAGLIHRDIKPGNIFAAQRGGVYDVAKLLDFGLVKPILDQQQPLHLTAEGTITGTPWFMSPEQATAESTPDARSDIYAVGSVAYYLLTGRPPFEGTTPIQVIIAQAGGRVVPPSQHRSEIPADLEQVILQCLANAPADRFPDAASLGEALAACESADRWTRDQAARWWQEQEQEAAV